MNQPAEPTPFTLRLPVSGKRNLAQAAAHWLVSLSISALALIALFIGLARVHPAFDLFTHFRVQYLTAASLWLMVALASRHWLWAAVAAGIVVMHGSNLAPLWWPQHSPLLDTTRIRAATINLYLGNQDADAVLKYVRETDPDFVVFNEFTPRWQQRLSSLQQVYPHSLSEPGDGAFGIALFSRFPLTDEQLLLSPALGIPTLVATLNAQGQPFQVIATHPPPPNLLGRSYRNLQLQQLAELARDRKLPLVLLGDLNVTSGSPYFHDLLRDGNLQDSRTGFGVQSTWPEGRPLLRIPIDHVLVSPEVVIVNREVGPDIRSDHRPVSVVFQIPKPSQDKGPLAPHSASPKPEKQKSEAVARPTGPSS
ncbi:endonuclease/exonuclease/phosphatase family protein [Planctomicrobium sp. SH664]|uniref:endonuclease/exonuclease/phosphatase family protein n=1 Tax=Planctomicrobium sp. SH664 TaxID=3448125 RepID=UPI003F5BCA3B